MKKCLSNEKAMEGRKKGRECIEEEGKERKKISSCSWKAVTGLIKWQALTRFITNLRRAMFILHSCQCNSVILLPLIGLGICTMGKTRDALA